MPKVKAAARPLRFAALIRVSTEKQERRGESLRTQRTQIDRAVESAGGVIAARYAGQEHGTAGWERAQLDQLLADAAKKPRPFDAVIVADATRWSRDNVKSEQGLEHLRDHGIRFFVLATEYDLFNPEARLFLGLTSTIGAYHARMQKQKAMVNRIERAKRGIPTNGRLPFGRTFDRESGTWGVETDAKAMAEDVAARYLGGESLQRLADEYGVEYSRLCVTLGQRCGDRWEITFRADDLNINETIVMSVPRLLPEATIRAVRQRMEAKRTFLHGNPKAEYLLGGRIFCAACGSLMTGAVKPDGTRYYRHNPRSKACPLRPRPSVRADVIEPAVVGELFEMLGDPARIERAVKAAVPDCEKLLRRRERIESDRKKVETARNRVLGLIEKDAITDKQAEAKLLELKEREAALREQLDSLSASLAGVPDDNAVRTFVERWADGTILAYNQYGEQVPGGNDLGTLLAMSTPDRRALIDSAFGARQADGSPAGVYLSPAGGSYRGRKKFTFEIRGRFVERATLSRSSGLPRERSAFPFVLDGST